MLKVETLIPENPQKKIYQSPRNLYELYINCWYQQHINLGNKDFLFTKAQNSWKKNKFDKNYIFNYLNKNSNPEELKKLENKFPFKGKIVSNFFSCNSKEGLKNQRSTKKTTLIKKTKTNDQPKYTLITGVEIDRNLFVQTIPSRKFQKKSKLIEDFQVKKAEQSEDNGNNQNMDKDEKENENENSQAFRDDERDEEEIMISSKLEKMLNHFFPQLPKTTLRASLKDEQFLQLLSHVAEGWLEIVSLFVQYKEGLIRKRQSNSILHETLELTENELKKLKQLLGQFFANVQNENKKIFSALRTQCIEKLKFLPEILWQAKIRLRKRIYRQRAVEKERQKHSFNKKKKKKNQNPKYRIVVGRNKQTKEKNKKKKKNKKKIIKEIDYLESDLVNTHRITRSMNKKRRLNKIQKQKEVPIEKQEQEQEQEQEKEIEIEMRNENENEKEKEREREREREIEIEKEIEIKKAQQKEVKKENGIGVNLNLGLDLKTEIDNDYKIGVNEKNYNLLNSKKQIILNSFQYENKIKSNIINNILGMNNQKHKLKTNNKKKNNNGSHKNMNNNGDYLIKIRNDPFKNISKEKPIFFCFNKKNWRQTGLILLDKINLKDDCYPLKVDQLLKVKKEIQSRKILFLEDLINNLEFTNEQKYKISKLQIEFQLLNIFPIIIIRKGLKSLIIDLNGLINNLDMYQELLEFDFPTFQNFLSEIEEEINYNKLFTQMFVSKSTQDLFELIDLDQTLSNENGENNTNSNNSDKDFNSNGFIVGNPITNSLFDYSEWFDYINEDGLLEEKFPKKLSDFIQYVYSQSENYQLIYQQFITKNNVCSGNNKDTNNQIKNNNESSLKRHYNTEQNGNMTTKRPILSNKNEVCDDDNTNTEETGNNLIFFQESENKDDKEFKNVLLKNYKFFKFKLSQVKAIESSDSQFGLSSNYSYDESNYFSNDSIYFSNNNFGLQNSQQSDGLKIPDLNKYNSVESEDEDSIKNLINYSSDPMLCYAQTQIQYLLELSFMYNKECQVISTCELPILDQTFEKKINTKNKKKHKATEKKKNSSLKKLTFSIFNEINDDDNNTVLTNKYNNNNNNSGSGNNVGRSDRGSVSTRNNFKKMKIYSTLVMPLNLKEKPTYYFDNFERNHIKLINSGNVNIFNNSSQYDSDTIQSLTNHLSYSLQKNNLPIITIIVNSNEIQSHPRSFLSLIYFGRLWRDKKLDILNICCYPEDNEKLNAGQNVKSHFNQELDSKRIKALFQELKFNHESQEMINNNKINDNFAFDYEEDSNSNSNSGSYFNTYGNDENDNIDYNGAYDNGNNVDYDDNYSSHITELNVNEEIQNFSSKMENEIFKEKNWNFIPQNSNKKINKAYDDLNTVKAFLNLDSKYTTKKQYQELSNLKQEFQFLLNHSDRRYNLLSFIKCQDPNCEHCSNSPIRAINLLSKLKPFNYKIPQPSISQKIKKHYNSLLEIFDHVEKSKKFLNSEYFTAQYWLKKTEQDKINQVLNQDFIYDENHPSYYSIKSSSPQQPLSSSSSSSSSSLSSSFTPLFSEYSSPDNNDSQDHTQFNLNENTRKVSNNFRKRKFNQTNLKEFHSDFFYF